jgi:hypothetical protein
MDPQDPSSWRRPSREGEPALDRHAGNGETGGQQRQRGLRNVRRLSNWTAVTLVAATAVTAGYFARAQAGAQQVSSVTKSSAQAPAAGASQPCVTVPVAVSGGSGVTTTVPTQKCAPGTGGSTTPPTVVYVDRHENERD